MTDIIYRDDAEGFLEEPAAIAARAAQEPLLRLGLNLSVTAEVIEEIQGYFLEALQEVFYEELQEFPIDHDEYLDQQQAAYLSQFDYYEENLRGL